MTQEKLILQTKIFIENNFSLVGKNIEKAVKSGCIDVDSIDDDDYSIVKAIAYVVIRNFANELKPLSNKSILEANKISKFI